VIDSFKNSIETVINIGIPEAKYLEPLSFEMPVSFAIVSGASLQSVLSAVDFNDETRT
jgi:hypothetical protein